jgi:hypothetical protein
MRNACLLRERTLIYCVVDSIGRWSMIDVFMVSILTATARMGELGSVFPGLGAVAFCAVVVLTMLAAHSFDPRLMWDAAATKNVRHRRHHERGLVPLLRQLPGFKGPLFQDRDDNCTPLPQDQSGAGPAGRCP